MPTLGTGCRGRSYSAVFAALTTIFAKIGLEGIDSDYAMLLRTVVIVLTLDAIVHATGKWQSPRELPSRSGAFLVLSVLAAGASWLCYLRALKLGPASQVAPVDKLSVVLVAVFAVAVLGERPGGARGRPSPWSGPGCSS